MSQELGVLAEAKVIAPMDWGWAKIPLKVASAPEWIAAVLKDFNTFLVDHAACERKAAATCMSFVVKYRDKPELIDAMTSIAREELEHFQILCREIFKRKLILADDEKNVYIHSLLALARTGADERLMDRLLISAIVEARGGERFALLGQALAKVSDPSLQELAPLYEALGRTEAKHQIFYLNLASLHFERAPLEKRLEELLAAEACALVQMAPRAALH